MNGRRPGVGQGTVVLIMILLAGLLGGNQLVSAAAAVMLLLRASGWGDVLGFLEQHGLDVGIIFLLLGLLLPFATDRLGLAERSEEHTSELQSRENLVCRLLLEIKKRKPTL